MTNSQVPFTANSSGRPTDVATSIAMCCPDWVRSVENGPTGTCLSVHHGSVEQMAFFLKAHCATQCDALVDMTAVDIPDSILRFSVVYHFLSTCHNGRITLMTSIEETTSVSSVEHIYRSAGWFERETWDMFGIVFHNNSDLRRILTDYGFEGFPLRKDFPLTGHVEVTYDDSEKRVVQTPVTLPQEFRHFDFASPWELGHKVDIPETESEKAAKLDASEAGNGKPTIDDLLLRNSDHPTGGGGWFDSSPDYDGQGGDSSDDDPSDDGELTVEEIRALLQALRAGGDDSSADGEFTAEEIKPLLDAFRAGGDDSSDDGELTGAEIMALLQALKEDNEAKADYAARVDFVEDAPLEEEEVEALNFAVREDDLKQGGYAEHASGKPRADWLKGEPGDFYCNFFAKGLQSGCVCMSPEDCNHPRCGCCANARKKDWANLIKKGTKSPVLSLLMHRHLQGVRLWYNCCRRRVGHPSYRRR